MKWKDFKFLVAALCFAIPLSSARADRLNDLIEEARGMKNEYDENSKNEALKKAASESLSCEYFLEKSVADDVSCARLFLVSASVHARKYARENQLFVEDIKKRLSKSPRPNDDDAIEDIPKEIKERYKTANITKYGQLLKNPEWVKTVYFTKINTIIESDKNLAAKAEAKYADITKIASAKGSIKLFKSSFDPAAFADHAAENAGGESISTHENLGGFDDTVWRNRVSTEAEIAI